MTGSPIMPGAPPLPVAPPPFADELLLSWLGRVGCRYGLDAAALWRCLEERVRAGAGSPPSPAPLLDEAFGGAPSPQAIAILAEAARLEPARLAASTLGSVYPHRPPGWFLFAGAGSSPRRSPQVCQACLSEDRAAGRDAYLRRIWALAERSVCARHGCFLCDGCPHCRRPLRIGFAIRGGRARLICPACAGDIADGGGGGQGAEERPLAAPLGLMVGFQEALGSMLEARPRQPAVAALEDLSKLLWSPLDGARQPLLALWFDAAPRHLARAARGDPRIGPMALGEAFSEGPFAGLGAPLRGLTLVAAAQLLEIAGEAFGPPPLRLTELVSRLARSRRPGLASRLDRWPPRAAAEARRSLPSEFPRPHRRSEPAADVTPRRRIPARPPRDYARLAGAILASPDWIAARDASAPARAKLLGRLMREALDGPRKARSGHPA